MAHPKPFIVKTPPPTVEETAKKLGVTKAEYRRIMDLVDSVFGPRSVPAKSNVLGAKTPHSRKRSKAVRSSVS